MIVFPNAKINLGLNVIRKREDGYHDINTVMVPVPLRDILEITPATDAEADIFVQTGRQLDCQPADNLVMKAVELMRRQPGVLIPPVRIQLHKIIPDGAGLGGGSADAAFALKALDRLFNLGFDNGRLKRLAAELGSDCAFFIDNKAALAEGRGELLTPVPWVDEMMARYEIVVEKPDNVAVSTAQAYAGINPRTPEAWPVDILKTDIGRWKDLLTNQFEETVVAIHPQIGRLKNDMYDRGALYASMSGSGSAVYGIFSKQPPL